MILCIQLLYVQGLNDGQSMLRGNKILLAVLTKVKQEDPYLDEWIEYHYRLGVGRFYIYDDAVSAATEQLLQKYVTRGIVEYIPQHSEGGGHMLQRDMFNHWVSHYQQETVWISQLDVDEFMFIDASYKGSPVLLSALLQQIDPSTTGEIFLVRTNFGTGGNTHQPTEGGVVSNYVWKAKDRDGPNKLMRKWIVSTQCIKHINSPHMVEMVGRQSNGALAAASMEDGEGEGGCDFMKMREISINHYGTKSSQEYLIKDVLRLRFTHVDVYDQLVSDGCVDETAVAALVDGGKGAAEETDPRTKKCRSAFKALQHKTGMTGALRNGFQSQPGGLFTPWDASSFVEDRGLLMKYEKLMEGASASSLYSQSRRVQ
jgi:hypothetical protein